MQKKTKNIQEKSTNTVFDQQHEYTKTLAALKQQIQEAQLKAAVSVNHELVRLYWNIGKTIAEKQETSGWGTSVIEKLAKDLQNEFPGIKGFSRTNLFNMRAFYLAYKESPDPPGQIDSLPFFSLPATEVLFTVQ